MNNVHGIVFAYEQYPELGALGVGRTSSALPFCGRYRLIDFALSSMMNAGISNVEVLMQLGYQSLIDHMSGGRPWNMVRHSGGLHMMPIGVSQSMFNGSMDALEAIHRELKEDIKEEYILLTRGGLCVNLDYTALIEAHLASGKDMTAACTAQPQRGEHNRFLPAEDGVTATGLLCRQTDCSRGVASLDTYIMRREKLLEIMDWCAEGNRVHFHRNALLRFMEKGMTVNLYMHKGYGRYIRSVPDYYEANMDMLDPKVLAQMFPEDRPVATRARSDVSSYYGDSAKVLDSLVADGCIIEGTLERCIVFSGARIDPGSHLRNCIVMNDVTIGKGCDLRNVIIDKYVSLSPDTTMAGTLNLPLLIPKASKL